MERLKGMHQYQMKIWFFFKWSVNPTQAMDFINNWTYCPAVIYLVAKAKVIYVVREVSHKN